MSGEGEKFGRYVAEALIGRGSMGEVWLGHDPVLGRKVAIKVLSPARELTPAVFAAYRERFLREARAAAALAHPGIVNVYDAGVDDERGPFLVMEHVEGGSLAGRLEAAGVLPPGEAAGVGAALARALACSHRAGIIHRDVKPANVLRAADGTVKLMDFGIARLAESSLTQEGEFLGSPLFAAPEQIRTGKVEPRSDLFSLGVTVYVAVTGRHPFRRDTLQETVRAIVQEEAPPPTRLRPELDPAWDVVLLQALAKDPAARFADADELALAFVALAEGRILAARDAPPGAVAEAADGEVAGPEPWIDQLLVVEGPDLGARLAVAGVVEIGRGQGTLRLTDPAASGRHCRLEPSGGGMRLVDLGSKNGTFVGGQRVEVADLEPGSDFRVGTRTTIRFERRQAKLAGGTVSAAPATVLEEQASAASRPRPLAGSRRFVLVVREGPSRGARYPIDRPLVIGRDDGDVRLDDPKVSRKHAAIEPRSTTRLLLRDLASANGTYLGGTRVRDAELKPGDEIQIGSSVLAIETEAG